MSALIFDRTQADTDRAAYLIGKIHRGETLTESEQAEYNAGLRGCYNITDLNRVEAKVRELAETLRSYGYSVDYTVPLKGASVLPSGYTQLEYIQSSGTQWIKTGVIPTINTRYYAEFEIVSIDGSKGIIGVVDNNCCIWYDKTSLYGAFTIGYDVYASESVSNGKKYVCELKNGSFVVNGVTYSIPSVSSWDNQKEAFIFDLNYNGSYGKSSIKAYRCIIYDGAVKIRDYVPAKNSSGTIGLFDIVNDVFYTNSGTGAFTAGAEIGALEDRDWQYTDTMLESDVLLYLANIAALRDVITLPPDIPPIPTIDRWIDWMAANDIERIVYELDRMIYAIVPLFRRCGTFRAGKNAQHLLLAKGVN